MADTMPTEAHAPSPRLRLSMELVPAPCWQSNLHTVLAPAVWDRLRRHVYAQAGYRCAICDATGTLHCHEVWQYDDARHVQRLVGCLALCPLCHHVKHMGHAGLLAGAGTLDYERVVDHFLRVNGCDRETLRRHQEQVFAQWQERSRFEWDTDFGFPVSDPARNTA